VRRWPGTPTARVRRGPRRRSIEHLDVVGTGPPIPSLPAPELRTAPARRARPPARPSPRGSRPARLQTATDRRTDRSGATGPAGRPCPGPSRGRPPRGRAPGRRAAS
jgi:hypothetical protein